MSSPLTLVDDVRLEYMAEGAANIVYRFVGSVETRRVNQPDLAAIASNTADLHTFSAADSTSTPPASEIDIEDMSPDTIPSTALYGKLLRLHKDVPWIPSYAALHQTFATEIAPLFDASSTITQDLVLLPPSLLNSANAALRMAESPKWLSQDHSDPSKPVLHSVPRPRARHGLYLSSADQYGLLIEDMSPSPLENEILFELKPKWLAQSPTAPTRSRRCRTCALRAMREAKAAQKEHDVTKSIAGRAGMKTTFCPLDLVSEDERDVEAAITNVLEAQLVASHEMQLRDPSTFQALRRAMTAEIYTNHLLRRLRDLQKSLDPYGVLALTQHGKGAHVNGDGVEDSAPAVGVAISTATESAIQLNGDTGQQKPDLNFLIATTLRDCTLFLRVRILDDDQSMDGDKSEDAKITPSHDHIDPHSDQDDGDLVLVERDDVSSDGSSSTLADTSHLSGPGPRLHITAKLGDLDLKEAEEGKMAYWTGLERDLIEEGWYEGLDGRVVGCKLER